MLRRGMNLAICEAVASSDVDYPLWTCQRKTGHCERLCINPGKLEKAFDIAIPQGCVIQRELSLRANTVQSRSIRLLLEALKDQQLIKDTQESHVLSRD